MTKWISRASVLRIIDADPVYSDVINEKTYMASQINNLPTKEETSRPRGEWIKGKEISRTMLADKTLHIDYKDFTCSACGLVLDRLLYHVDGSQFYNFCPNCGADMRKEGEKDD